MYTRDTSGPIYNILIGIMSRIVSKSSKMAKTRAFWKTHVLDSPAAFSMLKSTPALVGAENLLTRNSSFQMSYSDPTLGSAYLY
jgi:hypothetical protein